MRTVTFNFYKPQMDRELVRQIINIAKDNGYGYGDLIDFGIEDYYYSEYPTIRLSYVDIGAGGTPYGFFPAFKHLIQLLTSKEFIEAFCKYLWINKKRNKFYIEDDNLPTLSPLDDFEYILNDAFYNDEEELKGIFTCQQAIAIRDNNLEEFYTNLLA